MDNKVVQTLARAFVQCGWTAVRFNFRGVGATQGVHDEGRGELQDLLAVVEQVAPRAEARNRWRWRVFSFGAFVTSHALATLAPAAHRPRRAGGHGCQPLHRGPGAAQAHLRTLVVHGEQDDTVALSA